MTFLFLSLGGGIVIGCIFQEPLALAAGIGVLLSWIVGIAIVAPRAGVLAKQNLMRSLADPTEEDLALIEGTAMHMIGNVARLASDPETRVLFRPLWESFIQQVNLDFDMGLKNLASQGAKGIGPFDPNNPLPEGVMDAQMLADMKAQIVGGFVDPICDAVGWDGKQKENARAWMMLRFAGSLGGNGGLPPGMGQVSPRQGSGIDFRGR